MKAKFERISKSSLMIINTKCYQVAFQRFCALVQTIFGLHTAMHFFAKLKLHWESAHPNGISYADGFRYLPDGFFVMDVTGGFEA